MPSLRLKLKFPFAIFLSHAKERAPIPWRQLIHYTFIGSRIGYRQVFTHYIFNFETGF